MISLNHKLIFGSFTRLKKIDSDYPTFANLLKSLDDISMTLTREIWRQKWLSSINELTSFELQKKSWLDRHQENPHWSFVEFMCCYFDDLLVDFPYSHYIEIGWVAPQEYEVLEDWHLALDNYQAPNDDDYDREAILDDNNWLEIVKAGEIAKDKLASMLGEEEKRKLTGSIDYMQYT